MSDAGLFYGSVIIVLIMNLALIGTQRKNGLLSTGLQLLYTSYFIYGLYFKSQGGSSLVWWFYLIMINCLHFLFLVAYLIIYFVRSRR